MDWIGANIMKKLAIPIVVSIFIIAFVTISVIVYMMSPTANRNGNEIRFYGCTKYEVTHMIHCDPLTNKLVGYLFPGNQSLIYTNAGTPMFVGGKHGVGLGLVANKREAVEFANTSRLDPNKLSLSFWLKDAKHPEPYGTVISHYNRNSSAGWSLDTYTNGTSLGQLIRFSIFSEGGHRFTSFPAPISTTTFAHIVVTFDGSSIKIYKNGILLGITGFNGKYISDPRLPLMIGSSSYCLTCNMWSGIIDQFRFYNRAINESEVKEIFFDDSPSTVSDGLVGYWTFENNLNDISGNKNKGNLDSIITSMAFTPDGRLFFDEKNTGKIRIMDHDRVLSTPFAVLSDYYADWEQGLLGLTIDPKFEQNHFVYLYFTAIDNKTGQAQVFNRLVRFTENNNQGIDMVVLLDRIPASIGYHSGGALAFGPDDKLYIGIGDATQHIFAQDGEIFTGKVLRINRDGTIPQDNPFPNSLVYTIGHRNIFGLAFDKKDGIGIITENGDFHYDEINLIQKGGNYGFPTLQPPNIPPELFTNNSSIKPLRSYWQTIAPTQAIYYDGDKLPQLKNKFLFGTFTGNIYALTLDNTNKRVIQEEKIALRHYPFEPVVSIAQSPTGEIYFGGYHIYKLQSVDMNGRTQDLFPIEIKSLSNVAIKDLQSSHDGGGIAVNIHTSVNKNGSSSSTIPFLQMNIPRALIPQISSVTTTAINGGKQLSTKPVDSTITTSSPNYNTVGIHFPSEINILQLLINGISPKHNVQNSMTINRNTYDISSVSIVKYASDTSTGMPFNPSPLTVGKGTTVTWTNNDFATHTVTEVTNKFDSGILAPTQWFKHTFDEPGIVKYYCTLHPFMSGEVIVK
jgi:glucose/arabinose dehydrogenase/plastocyanin